MGSPSSIGFECSWYGNWNCWIRKNRISCCTRAKGFDMKVIYHNLHGRNLQMEEQVGVKHVDMDECIVESDFLSLHCSLNNESYHLIEKSNLYE